MTSLKLVLLFGLCLNGMVSAGVRRFSPSVNPIFYSTATDSQENGLLDTFSLSFVGNFDFSQAIEGIQKIFQGIAKFIDLKVIKASVDFFFENIFPKGLIGDYSHANYIIADRIDLGDDDRATLRTSVTTVVGAILDKQECWTKTACTLGEYAQNVPAKDVLLIMAEKFVPESWNPTLNVVKSAIYNQNNDCRAFICSPELEDNNY